MRARRGYLQLVGGRQTARSAVSMTPQVLSCFERLAAAVAAERPVVRVDPFVESNGRRVLEAFAAVATRTVVVVGVPVEIVFLEVHLQLEPDVALVARVRTSLTVTATQHVTTGCNVTTIYHQFKPHCKYTILV